jgi:hypothetical protein
MFDVLAAIESVYSYTLVECLPYDPGAPPFPARAFIVPPAGIEAQQAHLQAKGVSQLPSERWARGRARP